MAAPDLAATVLQALSSSEDACIEDTWAFAESHECEHVVLVGALKSLEADAMIVSEVKTSNFLELTAEGKEVREFRLFFGFDTQWNSSTLTPALSDLSLDRSALRALQSSRSMQLCLKEMLVLRKQH
jgi:PheRS DNA binding domain 1